MNAKQSKLLLVGTVVMWDKNPEDLGTVREVSKTGVYIDWANGLHGWIDHRDMQQATLFQSDKVVVKQ